MASRKPKRAAKAKPAPKPAAKKAKQTGHTAKKFAVEKATAKKTKAKAPVVKKTAPKAPLAKKTKAPVVKKTKASAKPPVPRKPVAQQVAAPAPKARKATPARDAISAAAQKRAINETLRPSVDGKEVVDAYLRDVDHPFKAEIQAVRQIILGASPKISERIKWNAPSFYYKEDLGAFNPRATEYAHLILVFPGGAGMQAEEGLLEGQHKDRREVKFRSLDEVAAKKPALEKLVKRWVALRDR